MTIKKYLKAKTKGFFYFPSHDYKAMPILQRQEANKKPSMTPLNKSIYASPKERKKIENLKLHDCKK